MAKDTRFWNLTSSTVESLELAPAGTSAFGPNQTKNDPDGTVEHDERVKVTGVKTGAYDARLKLADGRACMAKGVHDRGGQGVLHRGEGSRRLLEVEALAGAPGRSSRSHNKVSPPPRNYSRNRRRKRAIVPPEHLKAHQVRFSFINVALQALAHNSGWPEQWRNPEPKAAYDAIIIGAGGHGLATAYYLAKEHGLSNVAVLEKGWLGGGNTGRNTTIIRSNYLWEESAALYDHALKLWEGLSRDLNYNVMYSPRGVLMLAHNTHDVQVGKRHVHANRLAGVDNEWLTPEEAKAFCPILNIARDVRYPVVGAALAAARRHSAARRGRLGLRAGSVGARNRHHPELRSDGDSPRRFRRGLGRRDDAWADRDEEDRRRRRRATRRS